MDLGVTHLEDPEYIRWTYVILGKGLNAEMEMPCAFTMEEQDGASAGSLIKIINVESSGIQN